MKLLSEIFEVKSLLRKYQSKITFRRIQMEITKKLQQKFEIKIKSEIKMNKMGGKVGEKGQK